MLCAEKSQTLDDLCDIFDLTNIIKELTCFKKECNPSLVDTILTNKSKSCFKSLNFNTGVSDCHHLIKDRPFNLKGGYGFSFRSECFIRTTQ